MDYAQQQPKQCMTRYYKKLYGIYAIPQKMLEGGKSQWFSISKRLCARY